MSDSSADGDGSPEATPSSAAVLKELIKLRAGMGMTMDGIQRFCPNINALRVTAAELQARNLSAADTHVAAYRAIVCAVDSLVGRSDYSRILKRTLNTLEEPFGLAKRTEVLCKRELFMLVDGKQYRLLKEAAFVHFAGVLVDADQSPCGGLQRSVQLSLNINGSPERIAQILSLLSFETHPGLRFELANSVIETLPDARASLRRLPRPGLVPSAILRDIISVALRYFGMAYLDHGEPNLSESTIMLMMFEAPNNDTMVAASEMQLGPSRRQPLVSSNGEPNEYYFAVKRRTIEDLAFYMLTIESERLWRRLI